MLIGTKDGDGEVFEVKKSNLSRKLASGKKYVVCTDSKSFLNLTIRVKGFYPHCLTQLLCLSGQILGQLTIRPIFLNSKQAHPVLDRMWATNHMMLIYLLIPTIFQHHL